MTRSKLLFDIKSTVYKEIMFGKAKSEIACTLSWFQNWNEEQRNEFAKVLLRNRESVDDSTLESLMSTMNQMSIMPSRQEGPSIFECQLKIFAKWYGAWTPAETSEFTAQLHAVYPDFVESLNAQML